MSAPAPGPHAGMYPTINRKPKRWPWIVGIVAALFVGIGIGSLSDVTAPTAVTVEPESTATAEKAADEPDEKEPAPEPEPEPEPEFDEPTTDSFYLSAKTLEKQCFGEAGCNVTFRIEVGLSDDSLSFDPAETYEVTYQVETDEETVINTLTVSGDGYETTDREFIGTLAHDYALDPVVLEVSER